MRDYYRHLDKLDEALRGIDTYTVTAMIHAVRKNMSNSGRVFFCGNGGSASQAQHLAAELVGRFKHEREALPAMALTADTSILTAVSNDYGYERVFERQLQAWFQPFDILVGLSTSGESPNVRIAMEYAISVPFTVVVALTGPAPNSLQSLAHFCIEVPSKDTAIIQECHLVLGHLLCRRIEKSIATAQ